MSTLDGELADERRSVPHDLRVPGHREINDNVDVGPTVPCDHGAHQPKASKVAPLLVAMLLDGFDRSYVLAIAQLRRIENKVHVAGSDMGRSASLGGTTARNRSGAAHGESGKPGRQERDQGGGWHGPERRPVGTPGVGMRPR